MKKSIKITFLVLMLILIFYFIKKIDIINLHNIIKETNYSLLLVSFLFIGLSFLAWNYRYYRILNHFKKINFFSLIPILMAGVLINTITPTASSGGEPLMAYLVSKKYKIRASQALALTLLDKVYNAIIFLFITLYCILFLSFFIKIGPSTKATILTLFIITAIITLPFIFTKEKIRFRGFYSKIILKILYRSVNVITKKFPTFKHFEEFVIKKAQYIIKMFKIGLRDKHLIISGSISTMLVWLFMYLNQYYIFKALNYDVSFNAVLIVVSLAWLAGNLAVIPGGIGVFETIMVALYSAFGINLGIAGLATLLARIMYYIYALAVGYICLIYAQFHIK